MAEKARIELAQLRRLIDYYQGLLAKVRTAEPDAIEMSALSSFLHSFYTGIESIFKRIAADVDGFFPAGGAVALRSDLCDVRADLQTSSGNLRRPVRVDHQVHGVQTCISPRVRFRVEMGKMLTWYSMPNKCWISLRQNLMPSSDRRRWTELIARTSDREDNSRSIHILVRHGEDRDNNLVIAEIDNLSPYSRIPYWHYDVAYISRHTEDERIRRCDVSTVHGFLC